MDYRLGAISTNWALIGLLQCGSEDEAREAASQIIERYSCAIRRYICGYLKILNLLRDDIVDDALQTIYLKIVEGCLRNVLPDKGRFRDYLKRIVINTLQSMLRKNKIFCTHEHLEYGEIPVNYNKYDETHSAHPTKGTKGFDARWVNEFLNSAWSKLHENEIATDQPYYSVLRFRTEYPEMDSEECAAHFSKEIGRPLTSGAFRQILMRARKEFAMQLIDCVASSMLHRSQQSIEEELAELDLTKFCKRYMPYYIKKRLIADSEE